MFEYVQNVLIANPLEFYTAIIATLGVVFWAADRRSMKAALSATKSSEISLLRVEKKKAEDRVNQGLNRLKLECNYSRKAWQDYYLNEFPFLSYNLHEKKECNEINMIEREAAKVVKNLHISEPNVDELNIKKIEAYLVDVGIADSELSQLYSQIPVPNLRIK